MWAGCGCGRRAGSGAAELCWVCRDTGGAPARGGGAYGERSQPISLGAENAPGRRGCRRRAAGNGAEKDSAVTAAPGAPAYGARPQRPRGGGGRCGAGRSGAAVRGAGRADPGRRCAVRGGPIRGGGARCGARRGTAVQPPRDAPGGAGVTGGAAAPGDRPDLGRVARPYPSETPPLKISRRARTAASSSVRTCTSGSSAALAIRTYFRF